MKIEKDKIISHYRILSEIGKGGMGEVYLAKDTKLDRKVAIKFLNEEFSEDNDKLNRFVQEAKAASALNHPNIITIHEIGKTDNTNFIATEYIEGKTLNNYWKDNVIRLNSALDIAIQVASGLDEAHSAGIVHRDIKPDNIMIRPNGLAKILDFGIAKLTEKQSPELDSEGRTAVQVSTSPGMIIGTANYMSPEQAKGQEVDARTDIFSLGVVLYEMISGHLPFEGEGAMETIGAIIHKEPKPLSDEAITPVIKKIIGKTLRKNRDERYQTMKGLLADLKDMKEELHFQNKLDKTIQPDRAKTSSDAPHATEAGSTDDSISIKRSSVGKMLVGIGGILILAVAALGYWYFAISGEDKIKSIAVMPFVNESGNVVGSSFSGHKPISFPPFRLRPVEPVLVSALSPVFWPPVNR